MSLRKPPLKKNEFDVLIEKAINDKVSKQEPPTRVWRNIREKLEQPRRGSQWLVLRSMAMVQAVMLALVVFSVSGSLHLFSTSPKAVYLASYTNQSYSQPVMAINTLSQNNPEPAPSRIDSVEMKLLRQQKLQQQRFIRIPQTDNPVSSVKTYMNFDLLQLEGNQALGNKMYWLQ